MSGRFGFGRSDEMNRRASKIKDAMSSGKKEVGSLKNRRAASADSRSRGSYVPDKRRPSSEERTSGNKPFRYSMRKSSINLTDAKRKDIRPLTDKTYQKRKVSELAEFLETAGFSPPISTSKLMAPSKKDFENIFQFFYRYFDPVYEVKKLEEEAPKILKNLGYPFSVNKSAFVYVARTNWPSLLGVLIWFMDLNKFAMKVDMKDLLDTAGDDDSAEVHKILLRYICQCQYSGVDSEEDENNVFINIIKSSSVLKNLDELIVSNEEKKRRLASVEQEIKDVEKLVETNVTLEKNIEKFEDYILKMQSHYRSKNELCEKLLNELKLKESELNTLQEEVSRKQDAYDAQGFDGKKHLSFFEIQKRELAQKMDEKRTFLKELQDKCWETEIEYRKISEKAVAAAEESRKLYNNIVDSLKNALDPLANVKIPQVQKLCENALLNFSFPDGHSVQSTAFLRDAWKDIAVRIKTTNESLRRICASLSQKLTEAEMKKSEASMKLKILCLENNKEDQDLSSKKKVADAEISALEAQFKKLQGILQTLQDNKSELEGTYREMVEEMRTLQEFYARKEKELQDYLIEQKEVFSYFSRAERKALQECEVHGSEIAEMLTELKDL